MPMPRKHADAAARQRAYMERKRAEKAADQNSELAAAVRIHKALQESAAIGCPNGRDFYKPTLYATLANLAETFERDLQQRKRDKERWG